MNIRIGQLVRVKDDLVVDQKYGRSYFSDEMEKYRGKTCKVIAINKKYGVFNLENCKSDLTDQAEEKSLFGYMVSKLLTEEGLIFGYYNFTEEMVETISEENTNALDVNIDTGDKQDSTTEYEIDLKEALKQANETGDISSLEKLFKQATKEREYETTYRGLENEIGLNITVKDIGIGCKKNIKLTTNKGDAKINTVLLGGTLKAIIKIINTINDSCDNAPDSFKGRLKELSEYIEGNYKDIINLKDDTTEDSEDSEI